MDQQRNSDELQHYGVLGMKWGVRRATYKIGSANSLKKRKAKVEKDIEKLEKKAIRQKKKAANAQSKGSDKLGSGDFKKASELMKKSAKRNKKAAKREKTAMHNKKLLKLYDKRIQEINSGSVDKGKKYVKKRANGK